MNKLDFYLLNCWVLKYMLNIMIGSIGYIEVMLEVVFDFKVFLI